ncbi:hypothetical protein XENOCAPTIV_022940 [Xenoophorus captivus]|uniref:Uncharacterized protein n=1 Tax=Xenoophorus captivus TaxID=1517983 RepID=A0ABV0R304_9TELE
MNPRRFCFSHLQYSFITSNSVGPDLQLVPPLTSCSHGPLGLTELRLRNKMRKNPQTFSSKNLSDLTSFHVHSFIFTCPVSACVSPPAVELFCPISPECRETRPHCHSQLRPVLGLGVRSQTLQPHG